jgi:Domain of unknown function (DUF5666)
MPESALAADDLDHEYDDALPQRPRARYLTPLTALLMALILGGVGFYVGIRVEKSKASTSGGGSAFARAFSGAGGAGGTGAGGAGSTSSATGAAGSRASSFASRFGAGGFAGGGGNATIGSISSIKGNTIYVTETSGNTVKVKVSGATKISKSETVKPKKLYPGDQVVIAGAKGSSGTISATSVTDSGASSTGNSSSTGSSSSSSTSDARSAISSLFGGG